MVAVLGLGLQGCAARGSSRVSYTPLGVAQSVLPAGIPSVLGAVHKALAGLDMPVREVRSDEEAGRPVRSEIVALTSNRRIAVTMDRLAEDRTRVSVDVRKAVVTDRATATAVLTEIIRNVPGAP
jgi:hypothetical protein